MSTLNYKMFQGSVEFEESVLVVRILHIDDLVTTEIDSASKAQSAFEELVEDYLITCAELGKEPCRPFKGSFNIRVTPELHREVARAAAEAGESMNSWVTQSLENSVQRQATKKELFRSRGLNAWISHQRSEQGQYMHMRAANTSVRPLDASLYRRRLRNYLRSEQK